ncbi:PadR family transcriptional regulator [Lolliginicoccus levis]|uniref:PadR family transcriptional regulator n=1 Tax=Lolliginicoccus levis TaxID=2919542 RepID=UPI00241CF664|nr:PadR family transcriptional regulator [Lolliginicoccus levis]
MDDQWPSPWTRAGLEMCLLALLDQEGGMHGYRIAVHLSERGLGEVKGGTLYPALARMEDRDLVARTWTPGENGPGRKIIAITGTGRAHLRRTVEQWRSWTGRVQRLIEPENIEHDGIEHDGIEQQGEP